MADPDEEGGDPACWVHMFDDDDAPTVVTARVVGVPVPDVAVWVSTEDPDVTGDLDHPPAGISAGDRLVLSVRRHGFRWVVAELVEHVPADRVDSSPGRPPRRSKPHAHPARPPGTVVIAWLPFTQEGDEAPGKHRPCIVLRSTDPDILRVRPLYDAGSAHVRRNGGVQLQVWRAAGLDKPSVAVDPVEVPVARVEQTLGRLAPSDRSLLELN